MIKQAKKYLVVAVITTSMGSLVGCNTTSKMIKHGNTGQLRGLMS